MGSFIIFFVILIILNESFLGLPGLTLSSLFLAIGITIEIYRKYPKLKEPAITKPKSWKISDATKRAWEYYKTADELLHNRCNYFLVAESMLLLSFVTSFRTTNFVDTIMEIPSGIAFAGILISLSWYYVNSRLRMRMNVPYKRLNKMDPIYFEYSNAVNISPSGGFILTTFLPVTILFLWFYLFFLSIGFCLNQFAEFIFPWLLLGFIIFRLIFEHFIPSKL